MTRPQGLFDLDARHAELSAAGDPLERRGVVVDFEMFPAGAGQGAGPFWPEPGPAGRPTTPR